ncbi:MAG: hypothetical protein KGP29_07970 [Proteobacteria bacterium]|nr:hypothetical protein [Pseudomonadota bacterium]
MQASNKIDCEICGKTNISKSNISHHRKTKAHLAAMECAPCAPAAVTEPIPEIEPATEQAPAPTQPKPKRQPKVTKPKSPHTKKAIAAANREIKKNFVTIFSAWTKRMSLVLEEITKPKNDKKAEPEVVNYEPEPNPITEPEPNPIPEDNPEAEPEADDAEIDAFFNIDVTTSPEIDFGPDDEAESPLTDNRWDSYDNDPTYCYTKWRQRIDVNNAVIAMIKLQGHPIFTTGEDVEEEAEVMLIMEELKNTVVDMG